MKIPLSDDMCNHVADLYEQVLSCENHAEGIEKISEINKIIKPATQASLDNIKLKVSQRELPVIILWRHIPEPPEEPYYSISEDCIGDCPLLGIYNRHEEKRRKKKKRGNTKDCVKI